MSEEAFEVGRLYRPIREIADVLTASQKDIFVRLPGLLAYYPGGIRHTNFVSDHSGAGYELTQTGSCPTGYDGNPYFHLGNGTNYLYSTNSVFGLIGTEAYMEASIRGLTFGGWFVIDALPGGATGLLSKFGVVTDYGYALTSGASGSTSGIISSNGSVVTSVSGPVLAVGDWSFLVVKFTPAVELSIHSNGVKSSNITAIPASINPSTQDFEIGRYLNDNAKIPHVRARDLFICASALSDTLIEDLRLSSTP